MNNDNTTRSLRDGTAAPVRHRKSGDGESFGSSQRFSKASRPASSGEGQKEHRSSDRPFGKRFGQGSDKHGASGQNSHSRPSRSFGHDDRHEGGREERRFERKERLDRGSRFERSDRPQKAPAERKVFRAGASAAVAAESLQHQGEERKNFNAKPRQERSFFRKNADGRREDFPRFNHEHHDNHHNKSAVGAASRAAAAQVVNAVSQGVSLTEAFPQFCSHLDARDTAFVKEIVYGTLRNRRLLMFNLNPLFNYKITERHRIVQALLLTAMYQIVFMRSPVHAVVASTVSACGDCGRKAFTSLVNAILRRFIREGAQLKQDEESEHALAVNASFPDWLCAKLQADYGERAEAIMQQSNEKAPLFLRVENSKISTAAYLEKLHEDGIEAEIVDPSFAPCAVRLEHPLNVDDIPGFFTGLCSVQDFSAQMAAPLLELTGEKRYRVLDCCCAPGGKTAHILDLHHNCELIACDVDANRLEQTKATLERLGRTEVDLKVLDAQNLDQLDGLFDRILIDAPCSGTGVIRRHPDIKWLRREKDIASLCEIQSHILDAAFAKLKVGGIMVYTTCSILRDENDAQIESFLARHDNAELKEFTLGQQSHMTWQRFPGEQQGDGFFYARLVKKA